MKLTFKKRSILPGFGLALGYTVLYFSLIVLIPLTATFLKTSTLSWDQFWHIVTSPRALASYRLTFGASLIGAVVNLFFGVLVAWVLVRYELSWKTSVRLAGGPAICAADGGSRHCPHHDLRSQRLAGPAAGFAWDQVSIFAIRRGDRTDLYRVAVRCPECATGARGSRQGT